MESGGETRNNVEDIDEEGGEGEELSLTQRIHFTASCVIMLSGFMGFASNLTAGKVYISWNLLFMFAFGLVSALIDPPIGGESAFIIQFELVVGKHVKLLTSGTGKGLCIMIAGCQLYDSVVAANTGAVVAKLVDIFIIVAGFLTFVKGWQKTKQLSAAREAILASAPPGYVESQLENVLQPFAQVYAISLGAQAGLTYDEFNAFVTTIGHSAPFTPEDLKLVFKHLQQSKKITIKGKSAAGAKNGPPKIPISDLQAWFDNRSAMVLL